MEFVTPYTYVPAEGQKGFGPSITQPDLSYSIRQLVEDYSIGQLPPMALLQPLFDDDADDVEVADAMASIRGADRADRHLFAMQNVKIKDEIIDRVKRMADFRKKLNADMYQQPEKVVAPAAPTVEENQSE